VGSPLPGPTLLAMATSTPHTGLAESGGKRRPGGCRFGRGNGRGQPPGTQTTPPDPDLGIRPSGSGSWQRQGTDEGVTLPRRHPVATPSVAPTPPRNTSERLSATQAGSPGKPGRPDIFGRVPLPARPLPYLARIPGSHPGPFARWLEATIPLRDAASIPRRRDTHTWVTPRRREGRHPHPPRKSRASPYGGTPETAQARTHAPPPRRLRERRRPQTQAVPALSSPPRKTGPRPRDYPRSTGGPPRTVGRIEILPSRPRAAGRLKSGPPTPIRDGPYAQGHRKPLPIPPPPGSETSLVPTGGGMR